MESKRQQKFAKLIQKDLSDIFQKEIPSMLEGAFLTITEVKMTPDLGVAKVHCSVLAHQEPETLIKNINTEKAQVRKLLGHKIRNQARIIPNLVFYLDTTGEDAMRMDSLISSLNIPPVSDEDEEEED